MHLGYVPAGKRRLQNSARCGSPLSTLLELPLRRSACRAVEGTRFACTGTTRCRDSWKRPSGQKHGARRGLNPRRPAWETAQQSYIQQHSGEARSLKVRRVSPILAQAPGNAVTTPSRTSHSEFQSGTDVPLGPLRQYGPGSFRSSLRSRSRRLRSTRSRARPYTPVSP